MYLYQTITGPDAAEFCEINLNLPSNFNLNAVSRVEIFSASIADDGEDFCEVRVIDSRNVVLCVRRLLEFKSVS